MTANKDALAHSIHAGGRWSPAFDKAAVALVEGMAVCCIRDAIEELEELPFLTRQEQDRLKLYSRAEQLLRKGVRVIELNDGTVATL